MSRRNTDAITIHSILDWIEDNLESPLSLEKVSERSGYSKWHLQRMFKKETGHSLGQYIRSRKMTEIAQKLKESNEPILYLAERYGFESQQTLQPVVTSCANVVVVPPSQEHPPFDLNHMGTGSDKSDALGVPYYNQHAM
ncbi:TPA: MDR efflux pump AcrAB transcriptional activator MarA [Escherichia coli]|nr:MDR efflux pump AcrAB transcriptional activator MarA [Escherichia coli]